MGNIHEAARAGDLVALLSLLDAGTAGDECDERGWTALMAAAEAGQVVAIRALLDAGAGLEAAAEPRDPDPKNPPAETGAYLAVRHGLAELIGPIVGGMGTLRSRRKDRNGPTALMIAAAMGRAEAVGALLAAGASPAACDRDGFTALSYAAALGHAEIVHALLAAGAEVDALDHYEKAPIILAALMGHAEAVRALAEAGARLTSPSRQVLPPLHTAAYHRHADAVRVLLEAGADPNAVGLTWTALDVAIDKGQPEIVRLLARGGSELERPTSRGLTPAMEAVARRDLASLCILLEAGAKPDAPIGLKQFSLFKQGRSLPGGATALHLAACLGDPEIVRALLDAGADPSVRDENGHTPLMLAAASGHAEAEAILRAAAPPPESDLPALRALELVAAVRHGAAARARALLDAGASPDARTPKTFKYHYVLRCAVEEDFFDASTAKGEGSFDDEDRPVLSLALELGHEEIAQALIAAGASAEDRPGPEDELGQVRRHPIIDAAEEGRIASLAKLLGAGADVNVKDRDGRTPLFAAAEKGHVETVRALIDAGAKVNVKNREKSTPLSLAAGAGHAGIVRALLEAGAKVRADDLDTAAVLGRVEVVRILLDAARSRKVKVPATILPQSVLSNSVDMVSLLLDAGFDINAVGPLGPALLLACQNKPDLVRLLLDRGADANVRGRDGTTPLMAAVIGGGPEMVRLLLEHGADTEARADGAIKGATALIRLAAHGLAEMMARLVDAEKRAELQARDDRMIRLLLEHGADPEARDQADGRTALMHLAGHGREDAVRILLEAGAVVDARDARYGRTALMWAAIEGHPGVVRMLLAAGADPAIEDFDGKTAGALAAGTGRPEVVTLLQGSESRPERPGGSAAGALKSAAESGDAEAIRAALRQGIDVDARLSGGHTALFVAAEKGHSAAVAALLEAGADPSARDPDGSTPLIVAIQARSPEAVRLLLRAGADPNAVGELYEGSGKQAPLAVAIGERSIAVTHAWQDVVNGFKEDYVLGDESVAILRELIAAGAAADAPDEDGCRPLWYAFDSGQDDLADLLVAAGAGPEPVGAAYLETRTLAERAGGEPFQEAVRALARACQVEPNPISARPTHREWVNLRRGGEFPTGPTIGAAFTIPRPRADSLLAEHREEFLRRGAFLFRSASYGDDFDFGSQKLGLLPTVDPYVVIAAICGSSGGSRGLYIRDLRALEPDYSFALIACEGHSFELEFAAPIRHIPELARRLMAFPATPGGPGLPEYPEFDDLVEALKEWPRIGFYWE